MTPLYEGVPWRLAYLIKVGRVTVSVVEILSAGKSTLLKVLGGLLEPDAGCACVVGSVGYVFQNPDHQVVMPTVAADVAFGLGRYDLASNYQLAMWSLL